MPSSSPQKRVMAALFFGFLAEIINKVCPLITLSLAQKRLGLGGLGSALFGMSVLEMALPLVMFGYTYYGALQLPRLAGDRQAQSQLVTQIIVLRIGHALLTILGLLLATRFIASWSEHQAVLWKLMPFLVVTAFDMTFFNFGQQRMARLSFWVGGFKLLNLIAVLAFVRQPADSDLFAVLMLGANAGVSLASALWVLPQLGWVSVRWKECWKLLKRASGLAVVVFLYPLYERFDILVVEKIQNAESLGSYITPWRLVMSLVPIFMVIATTFLSENMAAKDQKAVERGAHHALLLSLILTVPVLAAAPLLGGDILAFVFDESLRPSAPLFVIFTASILAEVFVCILGMQVLLLRRDLFWLALSMAGGIGIGATCAFGLLSYFGSAGSAMGALAGRWVTVGLIILRMPTLMRTLPWKDYRAIPVGTLAMVCCLLLTSAWPLLLRMMAGGSLYLLVIAAFFWKQISPWFDSALRRTRRA